MIGVVYLIEVLDVCVLLILVFFLEVKLIVVVLDVVRWLN